MPNKVKGGLPRKQSTRSTLTARSPCHAAAFAHGCHSAPLTESVRVAHHNRISQPKLVTLGGGVNNHYR